jgi:uncharacterized protein (TIGR03790 family)
MLRLLTLILKFAIAICVSFSAISAFAGGGPENVLLVVNSNSDPSKRIANNYINWRQIPPSNVVYIDWKGGTEFAPADRFRDEILWPILKAIEDRHLSSQIDYIIYSCDFPWRINLRPLFPDQSFRPEFDPVASLNGATYLVELFLARTPLVVAPDVNWYVSGLAESNLVHCQQLAAAPSRGFRRRYRWDQEGHKSDAPTSRGYYLSVMLGITQGRGNSPDEILNYLQRSVNADGSRPQGTIYYMWNKDVRSFTRDKCFPAMAAQINATGARAVVQQGQLPNGAHDVAGMMIGASDFDLAKSQITILPGAICDHLTSEGGIFTIGAGQTPLSEFLRHGAAGASGTVVEPRALQAKFPLASMQLHYVRGCSMAESFYQSVSGPYQLLIVGEPLCQPWAAKPTFTVAGVETDQRVKDSISLSPSGGSSVGSYELFVDGAFSAKAAPGAPLSLDTKKLPDGYHELRVVGSRNDAIETQGRKIIPIVVDNRGATIELKLSSPWRIPKVAKVKISAHQPGAKSITFRQNSRDLGRVEGESGEVEISAATLGRGPSYVQAFSQGSAPAVSMPIRIFVE